MCRRDLAAVPVIATTTTMMTLIGPSFSGSTQTSFSSTTTSSSSLHGQLLLHFRPDLFEPIVNSPLTPFGDELTTISDSDLGSLTEADWSSIHVPITQREEVAAVPAWPEMVSGNEWF